MGLELSIVQDDCTGCGQCPEYAKSYFYMGDDGLAYVKDNHNSNPAIPQFEGYDGKVTVTLGQEQDVKDAAEDCPGECIIVEHIGAVALI